MDDTPIEETEQAIALDGTVKFLKILVTTLTVTTIVGLIVLIGVVVMRVQQMPTVSLPDQITLPDGATATAFTQGADWIGIVTTDNHILIYDLDGTTLRQDIAIQTGD